MAKKELPDLVVKSKVKELIAKSKFRSSEDVFDALNGTIAWTIEQAVARAKENGRQTVRGHDILICK
jgi:histone H3/H4